MLRKPKFVIRRSKDGQDYFVLKARNGKVILMSELYKSIAATKNGIQSVRLNSTRKGAFVKTKDSSGEYRFSLRAKNNKIIGRSEGYKTRFGRMIGILSVRLNSPNAIIEEPPL